MHISRIIYIARGAPHLKTSRKAVLFVCFLCYVDVFHRQEGTMRIRKQILDFDYEEVLDSRTRELIRVGCAVAVGCPT